MARSYEYYPPGYEGSSLKPQRLESKLKRPSAILYQRPLSKPDEVRRYILHSTDDERGAVMLSSPGMSTSRPQSEDILIPVKY